MKYFVLKTFVSKYICCVLMLSGFLFADPQNQDDLAGKCGVPNRVRSAVIHNLTDVAATMSRTDRPFLETSILSPLGHFRIHYDTSQSSINVAAMIDATNLPIPGTHRIFAENVAVIFDSVWNAEIGTFHFNPPPFDEGLGGGNEYDIYILNSAYFGETFWTLDTTSSNPAAAPIKYSTYITIDNDFGIGFRTKGLEAVKVTAAHEYFHAIQIGGYGIREKDIYFYELMAESMESAVFPSVRDYIHDLKFYYANCSSISLYEDNPGAQGYERAIWGVYLRLRFGTEIIRNIWERIPYERPMQAMETSLNSRSASLEGWRGEFVQFSLWNIFTGNNADTVKYYPDGKLFPPLFFYNDGRAGAASLSVQVALHSFTARYGIITYENDTIHTMITNTNYDDAVAENHQIFGASLDVYPFKAVHAIPWIGDLSYSFQTMDPAHWNFMSIVTNTVFANQDDAPFPNPFRPFNNSLYIPVSTNEGSRVTIYSSSMEVVWDQIQSPIMFLGKSYILWSGKDSHGMDVPSGIYFYTISTNTIDRKGKFAVLR